MRKPGEAVNPAEELVESAIEALPNMGSRIEQYEVVTVPAASPIRRAVDAVGARVMLSDGGDGYVKAYYPDVLPYLDLAAVADASGKASASGAAPALLDAAPDRGALAFAYLGEGWRWGRLDALQDSDAMVRQLDQRRKVHAGAAFSRTRNVFDDIETFVTHARNLQVDLPADFDWMLDNVREAGKAIAAAGYDTVPCHGDGASSNVMVADDGNIQLIDFDMAGNSDPLFDIGSMLTELCLYEEEFWAGVEAWAGKPDPQTFARCRLYGIADDLFWGVHGLVLFQDSPRKEAEFFKYGQWRLLRARINLHDRDFERWCRMV